MVIAAAALGAFANAGSAEDALELTEVLHPIAGHYQEVSPSLPGYVEMLNTELNIRSEGERSVTWKLTDCATGEVLNAVLFSETDNGVQIDVVDDHTSIRMALLAEHDRIWTDDITSAMEAMGAEVSKGFYGDFAGLCELRGTGQLGGILN